MATACEVVDANKEIVYIFRFGTTNKIIHLTEQQLNRIPYLSALIAHKDHFQCIQNENNEYVLNSRIRYTWFIAIFNAVTTGKPSALFLELLQEANILGMLKLYDYLCLEPISVPLIKYHNLLRTNNDDIVNTKTTVEYYRANLSEARDTAVQFIIALSKNEYNLDDTQTLNSVFSLCIIIFSNSNVFGVRLCHHAWTVVEKYCFPFLSQNQQCKLCQAKKSISNNMVDSSKYSCNDNHPLPENFSNAFSWKGVYVPIEENENITSSSNYDTRVTCNASESTRLSWLFMLNVAERYSCRQDYTFEGYQQYVRSLFSFHLTVQDRLARIKRSRRREYYSIRLSDHCTSRRILNPYRSSLFNLSTESDEKELEIYQIQQEQKKNEAKLARTGCFNTLPKRPKVDKFKHRSGPKTQKYRQNLINSKKLL